MYQAQSRGGGTVAGSALSGEDPMGLLEWMLVGPMDWRPPVPGCGEDQ